jgi:hypothetical protein
VPRGSLVGLRVPWSDLFDQPHEVAVAAHARALRLTLDDPDAKWVSAAPVTDNQRLLHRFIQSQRRNWLADRAYNLEL